MHAPTPRPTPLEIVTNPGIYCAVPSLFGDAWHQLKRARGQSVNFARIGDPAHQIDTPLSVTLDEIRQRAVIRLRDRAARLGHPPFGGDAA